MNSNTCQRCGFVSWAATTACKRCGSALAPLAAQAEATAGGADGDARDVRRMGMKKVKIGAAFTALYVAALVCVAAGVLRIRFSPLAWAAGLLPVAWLLAGLLQAATGVPFRELSAKWDGMTGWRRGLIGASVFFAGLVVIAVACVVILSALDASEGTSRPLF